MENPIFTLKSVVKSKGEMEDFTGPLALILQLLSKNKIEIKDISISLILEQYLAYLDTMAEMDLEVASEFVAMASHLVYIKTKMLLSGEEDVEELNELINSLEDLRRRDAYIQIKSVTGQLLDMFRSSYGLMVKQPEYLPPDNTYKYMHSINDLARAFFQLIDREEPGGGNTPKAVLYPKRITYSVTEKAAEILGVVKSHGATRVSLLIGDAKSRSEMVAVFIAVLELCRTGSIYLVGCDEELTIVSSGPDAVNAEVPADFDGSFAE
ncbi:condensin subunit ScpA [Sporobacter termitidis DSM 10068]|uniref:Segregation and condensation protein A n=1 Tax=Sporobacter termitidis DSM 10068 TaxID=1123282 RepID=A0A1M5TKW4_9FIRM|nr:segregation/condensation protein A [Sporobacter termitidis]SHH51003.1 condensin subunit ScpA [Sporobacter termitidis DSM 10068]